MNSLVPLVSYGQGAVADPRVRARRQRRRPRPPRAPRREDEGQEETALLGKTILVRSKYMHNELMKQGGEYH